MSERSMSCRPVRGAGAVAFGAALLLGAFAAPPAVLAAETEQAGVSAAVRGSVSRTAAVTQAIEDLNVGSEVFMQDLLKSGQNSLAQILLLDESSFKLGPESEVQIDEFVYNPDQGTGEMVARATTGTFRFISGAIGKLSPENVKIETPVATIGIRGTIFIGDIRRDADGSVEEGLFVLTGPGIENNVNARSGAIDVSAQGRTVTIRRTGWGSYVRPGEPPTEPQPIPAEVIAGLSNQLSGAGLADEGPPGDPTGGAIQQFSATTLAGQNTATTESSANEVEETEESANETTMISSAEELKEFQTGEEGGGGNGGIPPGESPSGEFNNLGEPISTFDVINDVQSGIATAQEIGVKMVDVSNISPFNANGSINVFDSTNLEQLGSYDITFRADFSAKTFRAVFNNIDVPSQNLANGELLQDTSFPASGIAFIDFSASSDGLSGISANQGCIDAGCSASLDLLALDGNALGGVAHRLSVGNIGGAGSVATNQ